MMTRYIGQDNEWDKWKYITKNKNIWQNNSKVGKVEYSKYERQNKNSFIMIKLINSISIAS